MSHKDTWIYSSEEYFEFGKRNFFSGIAAALQVLSSAGSLDLALEILDGLGDEQEEFKEYLRSSDNSVDHAIVTWLEQSYCCMREEMMGSCDCNLEGE